MSKQKVGDTLQEYLSVGAAARAIGLRRNVVLELIRTDKLTSQRDNDGRYYIPASEVERLRSDVLVAMQKHRGQLETLRSMERAVDEQIEQGAKLVKEAAADLAKQTPGTDAWIGRLSTMRKAQDALERAHDLERSYLELAQRVQLEGSGFLQQFDPDEVQESEPKAAKKRTAAATK